MPLNWDRRHQINAALPLQRNFSLAAIVGLGLIAALILILNAVRKLRYEVKKAVSHIGQKLGPFELLYKIGDGGNGTVYPGTCRNGLPQGREARSLRLRAPDLELGFADRLQGDIRERLPEKSGDFVIRRADGLFAYQLAVVVDDAEQGITDIVRGADLLDSTCRQIFLQQSLGYAHTRYLHLPVALNENGEKLSKQTRAPAVTPRQAVSSLIAAMRFLGQRVPAGLEDCELPDFWEWAVQNWESRRIPKQRSIPQG